MHEEKDYPGTTKHTVLEIAKKATGRTTRKACGVSNLDSISEPERKFCKSLMPDNFLHGFSEKAVYETLDDCFFLRIADHFYFIKCEKPTGGNMSKFQDVLGLAEDRDGLLPPWWSESKRHECEKLEVETGHVAPGSEDSDSKDYVIDHGLIEAYKDFNMPMKLRLLAEKIYGMKSSW